MNIWETSLMKLEDDIIEVIGFLTQFFNERHIQFILIGALVPAVLIDFKQNVKSLFGSRIKKMWIVLFSWKVGTSMNESNRT